MSICNEAYNSSLVQSRETRGHHNGINSLDESYKFSKSNEKELEQEDVEVVAFQGDNTYIKHTLSKFYIVCILFILGIGSSFPNILYEFAANPVTASFFIILNVTSGFISCHYLIQISVITKLESIFEILAFMGGGRASIIFFSFVFFSMYGFAPCVTMANSISYLSYEIQKFYPTYYSPPSTNILLISVNMLMFPFCLYKDVHTLKYYAVFLVILNLALFTCLILASIIIFEQPGDLSPNNINSYSIFYSSPTFCIAFECQYYFIALYSKLEKTNKIKSGY
jgi:hypothetical protein